MIGSMTAFARTEQQTAFGQICWELRSVNHRYLDIAVRLPEDFRRLEVSIREHIQQQIKRGKIDCHLYFQANPTETLKFNLNLPLAQKICEAAQTVNTLTHHTHLPESIEILRWPGVLELETVAIDEISELILQQFNSALGQLLAHRQREGAQLAQFIEHRCQALSVEIKRLRHILPDIIQAQRERLHNRLAEFTQQQLDPERLEQELAILIQKMDVAEELDRLETHLGEIGQVLTRTPPIGRRLDFLLQELHREANTLGAKANHLEMTRGTIELKVLIEQMREQIQNIE